MKLGYQCYKKQQVPLFNYIEIEGEYGYCYSHNFIYNKEEEEEKLYNGQPCIYTDNRYLRNTEWGGKAEIVSSRWNDFSLDFAKRISKRLKNVPNNTIIKFKKSWYQKGIDGNYYYKSKNSKKFDPQYQINRNSYFDSFTECPFSKELTNRLRKEGFIVSVKKENPHKIMSLIQSASDFTGEKFNYSPPVQEIAVAHGYGKQIGWSSSNNDLFGYSNGINNILWDRFGEFNKWSQCYEIPKTSSIKEIIKILKS